MAKAFKTVYPGLAEYYGSFLNKRWIESEQRGGKRPGAFCTGSSVNKEQRVYMTYNNALHDVTTMAHELGHAWHGHLLRDQRPWAQEYPMPLAETASIFCETIVTDAILKDTSSDEEELAILEAFLIGATQVVVDISSRFIFEKEVFERREHAELSADDFCEIMLRAQKETYGDGLDQRYLHPYM